ncbi:MAG: hypothetical protein U0R28_09430 [Candidatus Nanopelagicales bacterium]
MTGDLELTVERLRQLPDARLAPHEEAFYALLGQLTQRPVPRLAPRAWGDQLWLIGREAGGFDEQLRGFRRSLDISPLG